jgi:hypothetical protein
MDLKRLLPLSGIAFVAVVTIGVVGLAGDTPGSHVSGAELASFYEQSWRQFSAAFVLAASVPLLVLFGVSLATATSQPDAGRSVWGLVLMAGTVLTGGVVLIVAFVHLALTDGADNGISESALQAVNTLAQSTWVAFSASFGVMMLGAAGLLIPRVGGYRWLGRVALLLGIALFVPVADFLAMLLTAVWIIVTSVVLARRQVETRYAATPRTA